MQPVFYIHSIATTWHTHGRLCLNRTKKKNIRQMNQRSRSHIFLFPAATYVPASLLAYSPACPSRQFARSHRFSGQALNLGAGPSVWLLLSEPLQILAVERANCCYIA